MAEYMIKSRIHSEKKAYMKFLRSWVAAGCPEHFRCDKNFEQIIDNRTLREKLKMRMETPERRVLRLRRAKLEIMEKIGG